MESIYLWVGYVSFWTLLSLPIILYLCSIYDKRAELKSKVDHILRVPQARKPF